MELFYKKQPPKSGLDIDNSSVWERYSTPLGNGYFGASIFGYTNKERIQITENSLANPYCFIDSDPGKNFGLQSFCDLFIRFGHKKVSNYRRKLSLDNALFCVEYECDGASFKRDVFASYPSHSLIMRITSSKKKSISFELSLDIPFVGKNIIDENHDFSRTGNVDILSDSIVATGKMSFYNIDYCGVVKVINNGGGVISKNKSLFVDGADDVVIIFSCGTNYKLDKSVFLEQDPKHKLFKDPLLNDRINDYVNCAASKSYDELLQEHIFDYSHYYSRVELSLGEAENNIPTNVLLSNYKNKHYSRYLEALLFQYGRYLLISSSRQGALPANLQGLWSCYKSSPWSAGYWHNINVQMNYWPSWVSNLSEMFLSYSDFNNEYLPAARKSADDYILNVMPDRFDGGNNGYYISTGIWPYVVGGYEPSGHSGPGTGAFTSLLFYEHYAFTKDEDYLKEVAYPRLYEMSVFLEKNLVKYGSVYLVKVSASPENIEKGGNWNDYHKTVGCAFDQQMVYENFKRTIELADELKIQNDPFINKIKAILPNLDPVIIGDSGQIKEYREEHKYGEFGELHHRHVSQLVGLYPGSSVCENKRYIKAAEYTLNRRGDKSTGWATAHRLCLWSRTGNHKRSMDLIKMLISRNIMPNLWDKHPPFQIDGNFGYVAGVSEMLLQSHNGYIDILPCLPKEWENGYFKGLKARGNYTINATFKDRKLDEATIYCTRSSVVKIKNKRYSSVLLNNVIIDTTQKIITLNVKENDVIRITK